MGRGKPRHDGRDKFESLRHTRIPADPSKHAANNSYGQITYYEDQPFVCRDCGAKEVWTATQQKWWYEVAKGTVYARAVRCRACRRAKREGNEK